MALLEQTYRGQYSPSKQTFAPLDLPVQRVAEGKWHKVMKLF